MTYLVELLTTACENLFDITPDPELTRPEEQFGDYSTNIALKLAKQLGMNPREVAEKIKTYLENETDADFEEIAIAGPGFINFTLSNSDMINVLDMVLTHGTAYGSSELHKGKTIVAEYSDPNPFKVLHAGHLYTSLVGDAIANILEHAGAEVKRVNFGGDVGLHVGKTMWAIVKKLDGENPGKLQDIPASERLDWVSQRYVEGTEAYEKDEQAKEQIITLNKKVYELHANEDKTSPFAQIYWTCRQWSYDGFDALYEQLGMHPFDKYYPESVTTELGVSTVLNGLERGVFKKSDGAVVYEGEEFGLHTRVFLNSNGLPTYEAKDLGLALTKWEDYHFDLSVMITGNDIVEYMKVVLMALSNFHPEITERTRHLTHGMIKLAGGAKMSSRKGNILRASDVLDAAAEAHKQISKEEDPAVTLGAVKYAFLKQRIGGDIIYSPEESVSIEGNSGPYLQYAHARACSILRKGGNKPSQFDIVLDPAERSLVRKISEYPEVVETTVRELMPHHVCTYLYELAQTFNRFYEKSRVIGDEREVLRLGLVQAYATTLKNGLSLLNIPAPEKM